MFSALLEYQFLRNALLAALLSGVVCGVMGVVIIERKLVMMSGGIAHTAYGGVGLGYLLGFEPILGAFAFSIAAAFGIGAIKRKGGAGQDVAIGLFWAMGMALGIFFIALMPGYPPNLSSYLFGSILSVSAADLWLMAGLTTFVLAVIFSLYHYWKAYLFDEEFAKILGIPTTFLEYLLLVLVAMSVAVLIRVVGIILVIALLTAPAASAALLTKKFKFRLFFSVSLCVFFNVAGLWVSYTANIASGATIVVISVLCYGILYIKKAAAAHKRRKMLHKGGTRDERAF